MEPSKGAAERAGIFEAVDLLIHVMKQHHRIVERRVEGLGVHHSQHRMLMRLSGMGRTASGVNRAAMYHGRCTVVPSR